MVNGISTTDFTKPKVERMLPIVRRILSDVVEARRRLSKLKRDDANRSDYRDVVEDLVRYVHESRKLGVKIKNPRKKGKI
ncbi:MAG: hypothetical protein ACOC3C_04785, partial [Candidatus Thorarchaeota archaeon]